MHLKISLQSIFPFIVFLNSVVALRAQPHLAFADSLRKTYQLPELSYAVVSADNIFEMQALGVKKVNTAYAAALSDRFRIGSNTKSVTAFIAALLVKEGKINWNTPFFDLFPELRKESDPAHAHLTLLDLLSMRTRLYSYTYTYPRPEQTDFKGDETQQRYEFTAWFLKQPALTDTASIHFSNLGYVAAALMLEKVSGKSYKQLVTELGKKLDIDFNFGQPNSADSLQTWGHNKDLVPESPGDSFKLNWLLAAGNINVSLPDYVKFIQLQLKGLKGESDLLTAKEFDFLHHGLPGFALGWFWGTDEQKQAWSHHTGNPGTFLSRVTLCPEKNRATLVFMNAQTAGADTVVDLLTDKLQKE